MRKLWTPSHTIITPSDELAGWPPNRRSRPRYGPWWRLSKGLLKGCCCEEPLNCGSGFKCGCVSDAAVLDLSWSVTLNNQGWDSCCSDLATASVSGVPAKGGLHEFTNGSCDDLTISLGGANPRFAINKGSKELFRLSEFNSNSFCCGGTIDLHAQETNGEFCHQAFVSDDPIGTLTFSYSNNHCCEDPDFSGRPGEERCAESSSDYSDTCDVDGVNVCENGEEDLP